MKLSIRDKVVNLNISSTDSIRIVPLQRFDINNNWVEFYQIEHKELSNRTIVAYISHRNDIDNEVVNKYFVKNGADTLYTIKKGESAIVFEYLAKDLFDSSIHGKYLKNSWEGWMDIASIMIENG